MPPMEVSTFRPGGMSSYATHGGQHLQAGWIVLVMPPMEVSTFRPGGMSGYAIPGV